MREKIISLKRIKNPTIQPCFDPFNTAPTELPVTPAAAVSTLYLFQVSLHKNEEHITHKHVCLVNSHLLNFSSSTFKKNKKTTTKDN